ncbi:hypothetical protein QUF80_00400 [Desulfococcaceae bacterium HSG8]|nr:hypothetical protein [Desulfococcaceae bacterium HSG8]
MRLRDAILKKFTDRSADVSDDVPEIDEDIVHLIKADIRLQGDIEKSDGHLNLTDDLTLHDEEVIDLTGKETILPDDIADMTDDLTLHDEDVIDLTGKETISPEDVEKAVELTDLADDLTLHDEEIADLIGAVVSEYAPDTPELSDELTLHDEEIADLTGKEIILPEESDEALVLTDFLDEPSSDSQNIIDLAQKKAASSEIRYKSDIIGKTSDDSPDEGDVIELTGKEDISQESEISEIIIGHSSDDEVIELSEKDDFPPEFGDEAFEEHPSDEIIELTGEAGFLKVSDYDTSVLTNFLDDTFLDNEHSNAFLSKRIKEITESDEREQSLEFIERESFLSKDIDEIIELEELSVDFAEEEHASDFIDEKISSDDDSVPEIKDMEIKDIPADAIEKEDDTILVDKGIISSAKTEEIIELADVAVELFEDEDTIDLTGKERVLLTEGKFPESGDGASETFAANQKNADPPDKDLAGTDYSNESKAVSPESVREKSRIPGAGGHLSDIEKEVGSLLEEADGMALSNLTESRIRENKHGNLYNELNHTESLEQVIKKKLSEKIENITIDEELIKKIFSKKIESILVEMVEKAIAKERDRLVRAVDQRTET